MSSELRPDRGVVSSAGLVAGEPGGFQTGHETGLVLKRPYFIEIGMNLVGGIVEGWTCLRPPASCMEAPGKHFVSKDPRKLSSLLGFSPRGIR